MGGSVTINKRCLLVGAAAANHIWWLNTNPFTGLLLHPKSYRVTHLLFGQIMLLFKLLCIGHRKQNYFLLDATASNQILWLNTNPISGSLPHPNLILKQLYFIKRHPVTHHVIGCPADFVTQCLCGNYFICLSSFALIKSVGRCTISNGKVGCLHIGPG